MRQVVPEREGGQPFTLLGKAILLVIASLLVTGWVLLVADELYYPWPPDPWPPRELFGACLVVLLIVALLSDLVAWLVGECRHEVAKQAPKTGQ